MQKLATIGKITQIDPIAGADFIVRADVVCGAAGKWSGVVKKGQAVGDIVTVFLQDAILPPDDRWSFMEKSQWRVRMARFKGVPSECLIVDDHPQGNVGDDLTEALGVTKHGKPIPVAMAGDMVGDFPSFIPKTDEPNFQTVPNLSDLMAGSHWYTSMKVDGTSCTAWVDETGWHVCSRNWELREFTASGAGNVYWQTARKYDLDRLPAGVAIQFEIAGPGIQGNPMGLSEVKAFPFTAHDYLNRRRLSLDELKSACTAIGMEPWILSASGEGQLSTDELRLLAAIKYPNGKPAEGVVIRAADSSWSFKVINLAYKD